MRVEIDLELCTGHARCFAVAPDVYELDDVGFNVGGTHTVAPGQEADAIRGAEACPENAITILSD